jgi:hypothetical protein
MVLDERIQSVLDVFVPWPEVQAIIGFGSWFSDSRDKESDVDLFVYCEPDILSRAVRRRLLKRVPGLSSLNMDYWNDPEWWPAQDKFKSEGIVFDVAYFPAKRISTIVRQVRKQGKRSVPALRHNAHVMLGLVERSVILHDPNSLIRRLKARLYPYPSKLRQSLLARFLPSLKDRLQELDMIRRRRIGQTTFLRHLARLTFDLQECLFAINERYPSDSSRVECELDGLSIMPVDIAHYEQILEGPFTKKGQGRTVAALQRIVEEIDRASSSIR